jgi:hypothetical protein
VRPRLYWVFWKSGLALEIVYFSRRKDPFFLTRLVIRSARAAPPKSLPGRIPKRLVQQRASEPDRARPSLRL